MTENNVFSVPMNMAGPNAMTVDGNYSNMSSISLALSNSLGSLDHHNQIMAGFPMPSVLQGEPINDLQTDLNTCRFGIVDCDTSLGRNTIYDPSLANSCQISNMDVQERYMDGLPISANSLGALFAARCSSNENVDKLVTSTPSASQVNVFKSFSTNDYSDAINCSFATSVSSGCGEMNMNDKWYCSKFLDPRDPLEKVSGRTGLQPYPVTGNVEMNGWVLSDNANGNSGSPSSSRFNNELSLSLATSQPSVICGTTIPDQCSAISCNSRNLSSNFGSDRSGQFSQLLSGSTYLRVIQEILAEIASYSLENLDRTSYLASGVEVEEDILFSANCATRRGHAALGFDDFPEGHNRFDGQMDPVLQGREIEAKKKQLLSLLQIVDDRYNQCLDEIHTVISAFHAATELNPHIHARFALHTISFLYKSLRERISNQILAMGAFCKKGGAREEEEGSFESSFIQKQWTLQQLRRKDHQLWRPQRGLPERSVSVLRAWMFQNFLHPYPKDAEKHLLAVKSGLTRSQVSNWFINARVRLWKPMIEEMYSEMNRRKGRRHDEDSESHRRSLVTMDNHRFKMN